MTDNNVHRNCHGWSYWLLPVTAGDQLTIDFEGQGAQNEALFPVGTNDFNVTDTHTAQQVALAENDHQQALYTVKQTGTMPLVFYVSQERGCGSPNGPYDFTVLVEHALILSLAPLRFSHHQHMTTFGVGVHTPDGVPLSSPSLHMAVQLLAHGRWTTVSGGSPATFDYVWPRSERGKWQHMRVQVSGAGYFTATSRSVRVKAA